MSELWLRILLRTFGGMCALAVVPLLMPGDWLDAGHRLIGLGSFPTEPIAEYLARSVSALCTFYGGLLCLLSCDVYRFAPIIRFQAIAIMVLSACGILAGMRAGLPAMLVVADALGCWVFLVPILMLVARIQTH